MTPDQLPKKLLVADEVIEMLRLDYSVQNGTCSRPTGMRRLKTLRETRRIPYHQIGPRTIVYPRIGVERLKRETFVDAR